MTRRQSLVVLIIALGTGAIASVLSIAYLGREADTELAEVEAVIAVAARPLPPGHVIAAPDVRFVPWAAELVPGALFTSEVGVVGRTVLEPVGAGEPIATGALAPEGAGGGVPGLIPDGYRAISLRVDEVTGVNGFIAPGTTVDLVTVLDAANGESISRMVLEDIQVLAVGKQLEAGTGAAADPPSVVTLLTTPLQAERLALALHRGRVQLALRGRLDRIEVAPQPVRLAQLTGVPAGASGTGAASAPPPRPLESTARVTVRAPDRPIEVEGGEVRVPPARAAGAPEGGGEPAAAGAVRRVVRAPARGERTIEVINGTERTIVVY